MRWVKQRQGPRSYPRLTWDPAMSRVAAISGSRIRLPGEGAGKTANRQRALKEAKKQGVRLGAQALPTPQGWCSGRQAGVEGPAPGAGQSPLGPRTPPALCVSATAGWRLE